MKLHTILITASGVLMSVASLKAQTTVNGGLEVLGNLSVGGNVFDFGTTASTNSAVAWQYNDGTNGTNSTFTLSATRPGARFLWWDNATGTPRLKMRLDSTNVLTLFQTNGTTEGVVLSPDGTSSFVGSVVISGTNNRMPAQTLTDSDSILTRGLADQRYLQTGLGAIAVGGTNLVVATNGRVGVGTASPSFDLSLDGEANQTISVERASSGVGKNLTISAGSAGAGSDLAGGSLVLSAGASSGAGTGEILFQTPQAGVPGSSNNSAITRMRIDSAGSVGIGPGAFSGHTGNRAVLDVSGGGSTLMLGGDGSYSTNGTRTDGVQKRMEILMPPFYTNTPALPVMSAVVNSNVASLHIGSRVTPSGRAFTSIHLGTSLDPTNTTSSGRRRLSILGDGKIIVNETRTNTADFQIMGAVETNLFYVAVGTNRVGIGTNAPAATLHVAGGAQVDGTLTLPNQTITNSASAITVGQADGRYLSAASNNVGAADSAIAIVNNDTGGAMLNYDALGGDGWLVGDPSGLRSAIELGYLGTNAATTRTNLELGWAGTNAATTRANLGLGETSDVEFKTVKVSSLISGGSSSGFLGRDPSGAIVLYGAEAVSGEPRFYGWDGFSTAAISSGQARTNLGLGFTATPAFKGLFISSAEPFPTNTTSLGVGEGTLSGYSGIRATLDVAASHATVMLGSDASLTNRTRTDGTQKRMHILMAPFNTNLAGLQVMSGVVNSNDASLTLGIPSSGAGRSLTSLHFGTALHTTNGFWGRKRLSILGDGKIIVNETRTNTADFQIMGAVDTNLFYVAVGTNRVGIGTNAPAATLHVAGNARIDGALRISPQGDLSMGVYTNAP